MGKTGKTINHPFSWEWLVFTYHLSISGAFPGGWWVYPHGIPDFRWWRNLVLTDELGRWSLKAIGRSRRFFKAIARSRWSSLPATLVWDFFNEILALNRKDLGNLSLSRPKHVVRPPSPGIPWVLDSGNHQMAELFRLMKYDHLPRYTFQQWGYRLGIVFMKWDYLQTVYIYNVNPGLINP